jgi:hypothetical protein
LSSVVFSCVRCSRSSACQPPRMRGHRNNAWGFQASPGIRPVGAHPRTPMRVARAPQPRTVRAGTAAGRGTVTHGVEMPRGRGHRSTPLVAVTADQAPCAKPLSPTVPIQSDVGTGAYSALEKGCFWLVPSSCCRLVCYAYHAGAMCYCLGSVEPGAPGATQTRLSLIVFPPRHRGSVWVVITDV